jgi:hypothetical protein
VFLFWLHQEVKNLKQLPSPPRRCQADPCSSWVLRCHSRSSDAFRHSDPPRLGAGHGHDSLDQRQGSRPDQKLGIGRYGTTVPSELT